MWSLAKRRRYNRELMRARRFLLGGRPHCGLRWRRIVERYLGRF